MCSDVLKCLQVQIAPECESVDADGREYENDPHVAVGGPGGGRHHLNMSRVRDGGSPELLPQLEFSNCFSGGVGKRCRMGGTRLRKNLASAIPATGRDRQVTGLGI